MQIRAFLLLVMALLVAACTGTGAVVAPGDRVGAATAFVEEYKLGVGDKIRLNVYNEAALSGEFALGANGNLSLPLIGDVAAAGKTTPDITALVEAKLADGYLRDPKVSIEVIAYRPYYILGEVKSPGTYPYVIGITALNAVATAEGFTPRANKNIIFIRRLGSDQEVAYKLSPDLRIYPGDTIRLGERYF